MGIFFILYGCSSNFRLWVNGCCFFTKPTVYWRKVKGYNVPAFTREKPIKESKSSFYASIKPKSSKPVIRMPTRITLPELPPIPPPPPMPILSFRRSSEATDATDELYSMNKKLESYKNRIRSTDEKEIVNEIGITDSKNLYPTIHNP